MDTPKPPDPYSTAKTQSEMNQNTAITGQLLSQTNQETPYGSLKYEQDGETSFTGGDGKTYTVPRFTAKTTLTPAQQALLDLSNRTRANIGQIGVDQSARIGSLLGTNLNLNEAADAKFSDIARKRLDPMFARSEEALRSRLTNSGIQPGSEAWKSEMDQFARGRSDAYDQMFLQGRGQAVSEAIAERNQPINEITALMSGSQVSQPSFVNTPGASVAGVDYMGAANQNYQAQLAQQGAMMGGLFGLGGTVAGAGIKYGLPLLATSDRRLKTDVVRIGTTAGGLPLYEYTIFGKRQRGVMADEVEAVRPEAVVSHPSGFKMVDYARIA